MGRPRRAGTSRTAIRTLKGPGDGGNRVDSATSSGSGFCSKRRGWRQGLAGASRGSRLETRHPASRIHVEELPLVSGIDRLCAATSGSEIDGDPRATSKG